MPFTTTKPVGLFTDINGKPLDGQVFFGQPNLDPIANPITVYWDAAGTQPVTQPVVTVGGYPMNGSTRSNVFVNADYSILVRNRNGFTVFSAPNLPFEDSSDNQYFLQAGSGAVQRTVQSKLRDVVSVKDFGAVGDGLTDDTAAIQAAINESKAVNFPNGKYLITASLTLQSNQLLYGDGKAPNHPYTGGAFPSGYTSEILIDDFLAFDCKGTNNTTVRGLTIKSTTAGQSAYGAAADYTAGAIAFDIADTYNFTAQNVAFFGLEYGIAASQSTDLAEAGFWKLDDFVASDCKAVVKIGNSGSSVYVSRDCIISNCDIALHCNAMVDINWSDGVRIENCRFFQTYGDSVYLKNSPFVTVTGVTSFETTGNNFVFDDCQYVSAAAITASRAGGYTSTTPWAQSAAIRILDSSSVAIQGEIEHPGGVAVLAQTSGNISLNLAIFEPYYTTGQTASGSAGAIAVTSCTNVNLDCSCSGNTYIYSLSTDYSSALETFGTVTSDKYAGALRGWNAVKNVYAFSKKIDSDTALNVGSSSVVDYVRVPVPDGTSLVSRSMHMTFPDITLRIGALFWTGGLVVDGDGGNTSFEKKVIYTNSTGSTVQYQVPISMYNTSGGIITVPAGTMVYTSFAIE